jgi:ribosome-binding factor A
MATKEFSRKARLDAQLQRELTALVREDLTDPRVTGVTLTYVDVAPDLRHAKVLVSRLGDDAGLPEAVKALNHASGRLRRRLGGLLKLRMVPELHFAADLQQIEADRVSRLIRDAVQADRANAEQREESSGDD